MTAKIPQFTCLFPSLIHALRLHRDDLPKMPAQPSPTLLQPFWWLLLFLKIMSKLLNWAPSGRSQAGPCQPRQHHLPLCLCHVGLPAVPSTCPAQGVPTSLQDELLFTLENSGQRSHSQPSQGLTTFSSVLFLYLIQAFQDVLLKYLIHTLLPPAMHHNAPKVKNHVLVFTVFSLSTEFWADTQLCGLAHVFHGIRMREHGTHSWRPGSQVWICQRPACLGRSLNLTPPRRCDDKWRLSENALKDSKCCNNFTN